MRPPLAPGPSLAVLAVNQPRSSAFYSDSCTTRHMEGKTDVDAVSHCCVHSSSIRPSLLERSPMYSKHEKRVFTSRLVKYECLWCTYNRCIKRTTVYRVAPTANMKCQALQQHTTRPLPNSRLLYGLDRTDEPSWGVNFLDRNADESESPRGRSESGQNGERVRTRSMSTPSPLTADKREERCCKTYKVVPLGGVPKS